MNLVLVHCGKEWRAQRALLVAYALLVFGCLCLGFLLLPKPWWQQEEHGALALSWFVAAGVFGVVVFAAPALVKGEFGPKGDQFVRRLPRALGASFGGKLLFLLLVALTLPLLGLLGGELFLLAAGHDWNGLFRWYWDGTVGFVPAWPAVWAGLALLLAPWVWAAGTALPGGRMAVGGAILLVLLVGLSVMPVLRQHPNIEYGIGWRVWLWAVVPAGFAVTGLAWVRGRRGGGALRSARIAGAATLLGLVPPGLWLGAEAWCYRHPDERTLNNLDVRGMTSDHRFALVEGNAHAQWDPVTFRVDLVTGASERVGGIDRMLWPADLSGGPVTRWWIDSSRVARAGDWVDLATVERSPLAVDARGRRILSAEMQESLLAAARASTPFRAPGDRRMWIEGRDVCLETAAGDVARFAVPEPVIGVWAHGHGLEVASPDRARLFAPTERAFVPLPPNEAALTWILVGDHLLWQQRAWLWQQQRLGEPAVPCPELQRARPLGLVDDERLLAVAFEGTSCRLLAYRPRDARVEVLRTWTQSVWSFNALSCLRPLRAPGSDFCLLPRDARGRIWLLAPHSGVSRILRLDVAAGRLEESALFRWPHSSQLIAFDEDGTVLLSHEARIERLDPDTGARTILFPRSP